MIVVFMVMCSLFLGCFSNPNNSIVETRRLEVEGEGLDCKGGKSRSSSPSGDDILGGVLIDLEPDREVAVTVFLLLLLLLLDCWDMLFWDALLIMEV